MVFYCIGGIEHLHFELSNAVNEEYFLNPESTIVGRLNEVKSKNPHYIWSDGVGKVTCFDKIKKFREGSITYPVKCKSELESNKIDESPAPLILESKSG